MCWQQLPLGMVRIKACRAYEQAFTISKFMSLRIPNEHFPVEDVSVLLKHENAQAKGEHHAREAVRFVHWPYANCQQEGIDDGPLYQQLRQLTSDMMTRFARDNYGETWLTEDLAARAERMSRPIASNLYDELHPILIRLVFRLIFKSPLPEQELPVFLEAVSDFHTTIKRTTLRSKRRRVRMRTAIAKHVDESRLIEEFASHGIERSVLIEHLGTAFFYTSIIQCTEFISHTVAAIVENPEILEHCRNEFDAWPESGFLEHARNCRSLDWIMKETLRLYPVFGTTTRQLSGPVTLRGHTYEEGTVVSLDFKQCHSVNWPEHEVFSPKRWDVQRPHAGCPASGKTLYMPFGVGPRSCPGQQMALTITRPAVVTILRRLDIRIPNTFTHTRFLPLGVPVVMVRRNSNQPQSMSPGIQSANALLTQHENQTVRGVDHLVYECGSLKVALFRVLRNPRFLRVAGLHFLYRCWIGAHIRVNVKLRRFARRFGGARKNKTS